MKFIRQTWTTPQIKFKVPVDTSPPPNSVLVFLNGQLLGTDDYKLVDGLDILLTNPLGVDDTLTVWACVPEATT